MAGVTAFKEAFMSADLADPVDFNDVDARRMRYRVLWAFYENTAYRDVHSWAKSYRAKYGMYKYSRNIYNPAYRLGSFWQTHLFGGTLDPAAGNGEEVPTALPIMTDNEQLRKAIAAGWLSSNWAVRKDILTLWGSVMGDVGLRIIDDVERGKVYLNIVHPSVISDVTLDEQGNVKGYALEYTRTSPNGGQDVTYKEVASRDGDDVMYQTYLNGSLFAWDGMPAEWSEPYGFIPFVLVKHNDVGLDWGWPELFPAMSKVREADDLASKVSDQIRKMVDSPWLMAGVKKSDVVSTPGQEKTDANPEPGRQEVPMIYAPVGATATPLVANLNLADAAGHITSILEEIERDFPELKQDTSNASGDASGFALEVDHQPIEDKVLQRRANYDNGLVRAQQMMVSIGGFRGYVGFEGFNLESYARGDLNHTIDQNRPVFRETPSQKRARMQTEMVIEMQRNSLGRERAMGFGG